MKEAGWEQLAQPLAGRKALVTGGGSGIGRGIALELAQQGAAVAIHYVHNEKGRWKLLLRLSKLARRSLF